MFFFSWLVAAKISPLKVRFHQTRSISFLDRNDFKWTLTEVWTSYRMLNHGFYSCLKTLLPVIIVRHIGCGHRSSSELASSGKSSSQSSPQPPSSQVSQLSPSELSSNQLSPAVLSPAVISPAVLSPAEVSSSELSSSELSSQSSQSHPFSEDGFQTRVLRTVFLMIC